MSDPQSSHDWLLLASRKEASARLLLQSRETAADAVLHAGLGVEAALKACIMRRERFNQWPSRASRPDLYTHDIRRLMTICGLTITFDQPQAPAWHVMSQWDRLQNYDPRPTPVVVAAGYVEAAFGPDGIVPWLTKF